MRPAVLAVLAILAVSPRVHADEDRAKADALFEEAQRLKQAGSTTEACARYEEALTYNRNAVGTLLNVGKCNEDSGKVATAMKHYTHARDLAREHALHEHQAAAEQRIAETLPRVPRLAIAFFERVPNMKLVIDDAVFPTDVDSTSELRLDPGARHIVVTAPGHVPYDTTVVLVEGKQQAVAIPRLALPSVGSARRTAGKVLTFSGAGLVVTGVVLGIVANRDYESEVGPPGSDKRCIQESDGATPICDSFGYRRTGEAKQLGTTGTIVGLAGVATLGIGVAFWYFAPREQRRRELALVPTVDSTGAGLTAVGRF